LRWDLGTKAVAAARPVGRRVTSHGRVTDEARTHFDAPATRALFEGGKHLMHEREEHKHGHQHSRDHESSGFRPAILSDRTKSIRGN
jgi:hypothetical protein